MTLAAPLRFVLALVFAAVATLAQAARVEPLAFETASGRHVFQVEFAETPQERATGLMYRRSMAPDHGMLFDFGRDAEAMMWMQNTYVSLDMVFVLPDGRVHRIEAATEPLSTRLIESGGPVRYVVELVAGTAAKIGLKPGDRVEHRVIGR